MNSTMSKRMKTKFLIYTIIMILLLISVGCSQKKECYICDAEIQDGEHAVLANSTNFIGVVDFSHMSNDDVVCEKCQMEHTGHIAGHCYRCIAEFGSAETPYYSEEFAGRVCENCANELWADNRYQYALWTCESCGYTQGYEDNRNVTDSYPDPGICDNCYKSIYG